MKRVYSPETICVHGAYNPHEHNRARAVPLYQSSAFVYDSDDHAANLFSLDEPGFIYSRLGNPTVDEAEKRIALLEGGHGAVAFASGMAACKMFINNVRLSFHSTNIGDAKTLVIHPASTTHRNMTCEERLQSGISDDFIRLSVGLENSDDLILELEKSLSAS
jgi:O-acetylhomoserine/O-acetylserine sulfhydrylase-like pyridoxal-dependent enzyme